jgi:hypothetical protein
VLIDRPLPGEIHKIYPMADYPPYQRTSIVASADEGDGVVLDAIAKREAPVIADFGIGSGNYLRKWRALLPHSLWLGVDFDVTAARNRISDMRAEVSGPEAFLSQSSTLDHINFSHSLEHLADPLSTLHGVVGRLSKGGILRIRVPIASSLSLQIMRQYWFALESPRHFSIPSTRVLVDVCCRELGLTLELQRFYGSPSVFHRSLHYIINDPGASREQVRLAVQLLTVSRNRTLGRLAERFGLSSNAEFLFRKPTK